MKYLKMSRKMLIVLSVFLFVTVPVFSEVVEPDLLVPDFSFVPFFAVAVPGEEAQIPEGIRNNEFFLESLRLTRLAMETYEFGDYDASAGFAQEAIRFAELSDEFVSVQLIAEAKRLLDWADGNNIEARFPNNYSEGKQQYEAAVFAHSNDEWKDAISSAVNSIEIFAAFESAANRRGPAPTATAATTTTTTPATGLPRQYTVRTWRVERDCLWNIAAYPWVYGDPWRWRELYEANRDRMPEPGNPDLIHPGMVLEIPSLQGETRQGMWRP
jgi:hypothetical protein